MQDKGIYKVKTLARLSGFSPALLRAWEVRHGLLTPERSTGGQRQYTEDDLRILGQIKERLRTGWAIGEIARLGRDALLTEASGADADEGGGLEDLRQRIIAAAARLSAVEVERALDEAFARVAPERVIADIIEPAARALGDLWAEGRCSVAGEHLASAAFAGRLHKLIEARRSDSQSLPLVLCACLPGEQHSLGLLVVVYRLLGCGLRVVNLGAAVPLDDLQRACDALHPRAVSLSVARRSTLLTHAPRISEVAQRLAPSTSFVVGGAGTHGARQAMLGPHVCLWPEGRAVQELATEWAVSAGRIR